MISILLKGTGQMIESFPIFLFIVFLTLKLSHLVLWSWWWVFAPLWGGAMILIMIVVLIVEIENMVRR